MSTARPLTLLALLLSTGCAASYENEAAPAWSGDGDDGSYGWDAERQQESGRLGQKVARGAGGGAPPPPPPASAPVSGGRYNSSTGSSSIMLAAPEPEAAEEVDGRFFEDEGGKDKKKEKAQDVAITRAWFPETFLFQPQVVTDKDGLASVTVTVPDRLTDWRVLGLAHSRTGAMAGDTLTFQGTLPVYVDPILPPFLRAGDQLVLPVQVVNTTDAALSANLQVAVEGTGRVGPSPGETRVEAGDSVVRAVGLTAERAGELRLRAAIGSTDAVLRAVPVEPLGRPLAESRGGTLAAPREVLLTGPEDAEAGSTRVRLAVYPGALSVLRSELARVEQRGGLESDAYALLLSGQASGLLQSLGEDPAAIDAEALRTLQLVATQRVMRHARSPDIAAAVLLADAALAHPDAPVLERLGARLTEQLIREQLPDGTFASGPGWTLQRLLVHTAEAAATIQRGAEVLGEDSDSLAQRARLAQIRAGGAYERLVEQAPDPYTAAAILTSGGLQGDLTERLRERVRASIQEGDDGSRYLDVPEGVVRADGRAPSRAEATALAALALAEDPQAKALLPDLGATLVSGYTPGRGWGDGRANLTCLRAVLALFSTPLPDELQITLKLDGRVLDEASFDRTALREVLMVEVPVGDDALGTHTWTIEASPALPGLGYALTLQSWVPWEQPTSERGLEVTLDLPDALSVGQPARLKLSAVAPSSTPFVIEQRLPAGVQIDEDSLQDLVDLGSLTAFNAEDGLIRLEAPALSPGDVFNVEYVVIPTLAGTLHSGALSIAPASQEALAIYVPPAAWEIR